MFQLQVLVQMWSKKISLNLMIFIYKRGNILYNIRSFFFNFSHFGEISHKRKTNVAEVLKTVIIIPGHDLNDFTTHKTT
jgi:hypothetical protein